MKAKINIRMYLVGLVATILTAVLITASFYRISEDEVWKQLETAGKIFSSAGMDLDKLNEMSGSINDYYRVTLIDRDGTVLFDSRMDIKKMENHADREEVMSAKEGQTTKVTRESETVGKMTRYYAMSIGQGRVLRVALDSDTINKTYLSVLPSIILVAFFAYALCFFLSRSLTKGIIRPMEEMAKGSIDAPYPELEPFAQSIKERTELEKIKAEFTANISHELKTPLTSISGYAELIESDMVMTKDVKEFASRIHSESKRMMTLIADIMKLSELEDTNITYSFKKFAIADVVRECFSSLELSAETHQVTLQMEGNDEVMINGDRKMISEVVYNLCDNAIRYNYKGGSVRVSIAEGDDAVYLNVKDTGIGIPEKSQKDIFRRFYRVDKSRSKATGGTGLGLAIVKHVCELHHARIKVISKEGKGTTIMVIFPV
ncbi:MAG: two-component sensor histidine kinase [Lachnoclostridium sp.]|jgi:two-component system phosphate regulon sensor histidine kinase PhoR|nr:two-component sensor histidine kinase [Lachnoclostridium sp.]